MDFLHVYRSNCSHTLQLHSGNVLNMPTCNTVLGECRLHTCTIQKHYSGDIIMEDKNDWDLTGIWQIHLHGKEPPNSINAVK
jgi:hypothetical protein